jgi:hypothetical protein
MALTAWSLQTGWIAVALISLVIMAPLGTALIEPRRRTIDRLARGAPDGPLPESLERHTHDPVLSDSAADHSRLAAGHRLPDDYQAFTHRLPHRDSDRSGPRACSSLMRRASEGRAWPLSRVGIL